MRGGADGWRSRAGRYCPSHTMPGGERQSGREPTLRDSSCVPRRASPAAPSARCGPMPMIGHGFWSPRHADSAMHARRITGRCGDRLRARGRELPGEPRGVGRMLPDFRFVIGAVLAMAVLGTTAFGMLVAVRATHQTKAGPLEVSRNLAFDDRADWNQFYDPDSGRRFEELARKPDVPPPPARPLQAPTVEPAAAEGPAEVAASVAPAE